VSNISKLYITLLDLLSNALFDANKEIDLENVDFKELFKESKQQTVCALAFDQLPASASEAYPEVYLAWQLYCLKVVQSNISSFAANYELEKLLTNAGFPMCTIKGFSCAYYYPDSTLRQMGDIDFIIHKEKLKACENFLISQGFVRADDDGDHDFHISFKKNQMLYEMHERVTTFVDDAGYIEQYLQNVIETAVEVEFDTGKMLIPDTFTHGLIMLLHMQRHMISGGGIGLRHLCDFAVFVNAINNEDWIAMFSDKLKKVKLWKFAKVLGKISEKYLHVQTKEWFVDADEELVDQLLGDMILAGNFGYKDKKRYQELAFVSRDVNHRGKVAGLFNSYINKVYSWSPAVKKHKVLLPFAMIAYPIRTAFLVIFKKKKVSFAENLKSGSSRNDLYSKIFRN